MLEASLFLDCIFLLINDKSVRFQKLIAELIEIYEEEAKVREGSDAELVRFYIALIKELMSAQLDRDDPDALTTVLIKVRTNKALTKYTDICDLLRDAFASRHTLTDEQMVAVSRKLDGIIARVRGTVIRRRVDKANRKVFAKLQSGSGVDPVHQLAGLKDIQVELNRMIEDINLADDDNQTVYTGVQPTGLIIFHDRATIKEALSKRTARDTRGVIRSGLQGLNRALGEAGGLIPGESICHCALSHHAKSLMIVKWALWGIENNPRVDTAEGTPLVLFISLENEEYRNMIDIFKMKYIAIEGKQPKGLSDEEIETWIMDYFGKYGTRFVIERYAEGFGFKEYQQRLQYWKSLGYHVVMTCLDYLSNMSLHSDDPHASKSSRDNGLRELSYRLVNHARIGGYAFVTGHQLNRKAEEIAEINPVPVKKFNFNCLQDSSSIYREFDIIHFQYNEVVLSSGIKYFEGFVPKHRHVNDTPEAHKFYAYPYLPGGVGIKDDLGGAPGFVTDPYAAEFASTDAFDEVSGRAPKVEVAVDAF